MKPQRDDWPRHIEVVGAGSQEQRDEAMRRLRLAIRDAGYTSEDERTLLVALTANMYRAMLLAYEGGTDLWLIERPYAWPPQNWTLPMWRSRLHSAPCGECGHKREDTCIDCRCACHDLVADILNSGEESDADA
jgi:hypothetical protein